MKNIPFYPADILLPPQVTEKWPVIACDQFTSEPEYWKAAGEFVGDSPSTLKITLPEVWLTSSDVEKRTEAVNSEMKKYLASGVLTEYKNAVVYVERTQPDGRVRRGVVGMVDLSEYDYTPGAKTMIRATEGTVLSRIPPRVKIRKDAPLELPHIMILIDDPDNTVIPKNPDGSILYDTDLMAGGGHIRGSLVSESGVKNIISALENLAGDRESPLLFAVGDGNHSLATAKACVSEEFPLSRFALAEVVNIHDPALDFEPIYRVVFGVDPADIIAAAKRHFGAGNEKTVKCLYNEGEDEITVNGLPAGAVQSFIDEYLTARPDAYCDYIHGEDTVRKLSSEKNTVGFIFDGIGKSELFPYVEKYGSLPRKTFSMGGARDKRYYMECRKIK